MKAMKGLSMNKMLGGIKRRPTNGAAGAASASSAAANTQSTDLQEGSPEQIAARNVKAFCEASGQENSGDEVTFLPSIVDAAESSPAAASECARMIRKYLNKEHSSRPSYQYNAVMLMRILADNPGATFTRNLRDKKFLDTSKELLRYGRDPSVRQMFMETLDSFEATKAYDEGVQPLVEMWKKEKEKAYRAYGAPQQGAAPVPRTLNAPAFNAHSQNYFARSHSNRRLPDPIELANRLEEARTSAKLLQQVVACTPPAEVLSHELIREFADRCLSASRSIQGYMTAENPGPDNDTMEHLIDTNEQLQQALNQHQRAVLNARKVLGVNEPGQQQQGSGPVSPVDHQQQQQAYPGGNADSLNGASRAAAAPSPPVPSRKAVGKQPRFGGSMGTTTTTTTTEAGPSRSASGTPRPVPSGGEDAEDPFRDPVEEPAQHPTTSMTSKAKAALAGAGSNEPPRLAFEPYHPGFNASAAAAQQQQQQQQGADDAADEGRRGADGAAAAAATYEVSPIRTRSRGLTRDSESDLYNDSDEDRYKPLQGGSGAAAAGEKAGGQGSEGGPVYRY